MMMMMIMMMMMNDVMVVIGLCRAQRITSPNAAVLVGSAITFNCHTNSSRVCWTYQANVSNSYDTVVDICRESYDDKFVDKCNVTNRADGTYALAIDDVRLSDSGFYSCGNCFNMGKATAHLLVLGITYAKHIYIMN